MDSFHNGRRRPLTQSQNENPNRRRLIEVENLREIEYWSWNGFRGIISVQSMDLRANDNVLP